MEAADCLVELLPSPVNDVFKAGGGQLAINIKADINY